MKKTTVITAALCALLLTLAACTAQPSAPAEKPRTGTAGETASVSLPSELLPASSSEPLSGQTPAIGPDGSATAADGTGSDAPTAVTTATPTAETPTTETPTTETPTTETPTTETPTTETPTTETPTTETPTTETPVETETPTPRPPLSLSGSAVSNTGKAINVYFEYEISEDEEGNFEVRVTAYLDHYSLICTKRTSGNNITVGGEVVPFSTPSFNFENVKHRTFLAEAEAVFTPETLPPELTLSACWLFNGTYSGQSIGLIKAETTLDLSDYARPPAEPTPAETDPTATAAPAETDPAPVTPEE